MKRALCSVNMMMPINIQLAIDRNLKISYVRVGTKFVAVDRKENELISTLEFPIFCNTHTHSNNTHTQCETLNMEKSCKFLFTTANDKDKLLSIYGLYDYQLSDERMKMSI